MAMGHHLVYLLYRKKRKTKILKNARRLEAQLLQDNLIVRIPHFLFLEKRELEDHVHHKVDKLSSNCRSRVNANQGSV